MQRKTNGRLHVAELFRGVSHDQFFNCHRILASMLGIYPPGTISRFTTSQHMRHGAHPPGITAGATAVSSTLQHVYHLRLAPSVSFHTASMLQTTMRPLPPSSTKPRPAPSPVRWPSNTLFFSTTCLGECPPARTSYTAGGTRPPRMLRHRCARVNVAAPAVARSAATGSRA